MSASFKASARVYVTDLTLSQWHPVYKGQQHYISSYLIAGFQRGHRSLAIFLHSQFFFVCKAQICKRYFHKITGTIRENHCKLKQQPCLTQEVFAVHPPIDPVPTHLPMDTTRVATTASACTKEATERKQKPTE